VEELLADLVRQKYTDQKALRSSIDDLKQRIPQPLAAGFVRPDKATAIAGYVSRFN
jgi:hypothetical protein